MNFRGLILVLVEEEVLFRGVVGPYVFDTFVYFAFVFYFLEIFDDFEGRTAAHSVVDELVFMWRAEGASSSLEANSRVQYIVLFLFECAKIAIFLFLTRLMGKYFMPGVCFSFRA